jgi:hypothetical protein
MLVFLNNFANFFMLGPYMNAAHFVFFVPHELIVSKHTTSYDYTTLNII